jgi:MFS family permease
VGKRVGTDESGVSVMLAGRSFQGIGSGIILSLVEIVLADLVSLSER